MILPTVSVLELDNPDFEECLMTCLINKPARVIIVTDTGFRAIEVNRQLLSIRDKIQKGLSSFLSELGLTDISGVDVQVTYTGLADKRRQMTYTIQYIQTRLVMFLDDHVFLPRSFLDSVVPVFENPCVGLYGTKKALFWNVMGALYLECHNFEIRATNAMDRGVFVVSGRALVILTEILDNNFCKNYEIKIQFTDNAIIEIILGQYPKIVAQLFRWAHTTFRSNSCALFTDCIVWQRSPWTDGGMLYTLTKTNFYSELRNQILLLLYFGGWVYLTKLVKLIPYFWRYPTDFFLFFFLIPAYPLFAYGHLILKLWAGITFWNHS
ncbi:hypothetical protein F5882DRAFT_449991 [Hyaloscypha sp. PMI_1271]|nr:hypothetical protein F5882DRAFT_449991 [Hyaloscypha sp. PMI_1271]